MRYKPEHEILPDETFPEWIARVSGAPLNEDGTIEMKVVREEDHPDGDNAEN